MATEYVVLMEEVGPNDSRSWLLFGGTIQASSNEAAVRRAVKDHDHGGIFCAVPVRSWQPLEVKMKVERSMSIGEPGQFSEPEPVPEEEPEPESGVGPEDEEPVESVPFEPDGDEEVIAAAEAIAAAVAAGEMPADAAKPGREPPEGARY